MTMPVGATQEARRLRGRHVLGAMLAFFGVIVVADATMIYKAVTTFGGVDNVNAYRDGLAYNARIASAERQAKLGWRDTVEILADPDRIRVSLTDAKGQPLSALKVEATLGRPATVRSDAVLPLAETAPGVFEAVLPESGEGAWIATVRAFQTDSEEPAYQNRRRLWVKP